MGTFGGSPFNPVDNVSTILNSSNQIQTTSGTSSLKAGGSNTFSSGTATMGGFAATFTPNAGVVAGIFISGTATSSSTGGGNVTATLYYGTGTAPSAGASPSGTSVGTFVIPIPANATINFSAVLKTGTLTSGTKYWFDFAAPYINSTNNLVLSNVSILIQQFTS